MFHCLWPKQQSNIDSHYLVLLMTIIFSLAFLFIDQKTRNEKNQEIDESNNRHDELPDAVPASQRRGGDQDD